MIELGAEIGLPSCRAHTSKYRAYLLISVSIHWLVCGRTSSSFFFSLIKSVLELKGKAIISFLPIPSVTASAFPFARTYLVHMSFTKFSTFSVSGLTCVIFLTHFLNLWTRIVFSVYIKLHPCTLHMCTLITVPDTWENFDAMCVSLAEHSVQLVLSLLFPLRISVRSKAV